MRFRVEGEREVFRGRIIRVVNRDFRLPNGRRTTFNVVEHPGAVAIVPVFENGDVVLLKQFRPSVAEELFEIPAGRTSGDSRAHDSPECDEARNLR